MNERRLQFWSLYLTRFAEGFGVIALTKLLGPYITELDPSATTIFGLTIGAGIVIGLFTSGFTLAQTAAVIPIAWGGDRYDKRTILLLTLGIGIIVYALFPLVSSAWGFIGMRALQGIAVTGTGLMSLSLVGQIADSRSRANAIGKANAAGLAASIFGSIAAGVIYDAFGFGPVFIVIVVLMVVAWLGIYAFLEPDETRIEGFRSRISQSIGRSRRSRASGRSTPSPSRSFERGCRFTPASPSPTAASRSAGSRSASRSPRRSSPTCSSSP